VFHGKLNSTLCYCAPHTGQPRNSSARGSGATGSGRRRPAGHSGLNCSRSRAVLQARQQQADVRPPGPAPRAQQAAGQAAAPTAAEPGTAGKDSPGVSAGVGLGPELSWETVAEMLAALETGGWCMPGEQSCHGATAAQGRRTALCSTSIRLTVTRIITKRRRCCVVVA